MKNKKMTYLLGLAVAVVWGLIIYRVFAAADGNDDDTTPTAVNIKKEPFNDFAIHKDTTHLLLNYRDPFGLIAPKDTTTLFVKKHRLIANNISAKPAINWGFIQYAGYIRNPNSKKLITLVNINGKSETLADGEQKDDVKLIRNLRDSIKISFGGKIKFIHLKSTTP
jgi:hypothetical protein